MLSLQVKEDGQSVDAKARARGFHEKLTTRVFVEFGNFMWDVVINLASLSKFLQRRDCSIADVANQLAGHVAVLEKYSEQ